MTVIAISRLRLGLATEVNLPLTGLPLALSAAAAKQGNDHGDEEAAPGTALALLTHNLAHHWPGFQPTATIVAMRQI